MSDNTEAKIVVVGAGWWTQGWHLPCLDNNPRVKLVGIVDTSEHPKSNLNPDLEPLSTLADKYGTRIFLSSEDLLREYGDDLDGVIVCTPHATHYDVGKLFMDESNRRAAEGKNEKPLHILMEKPMTTDMQDAILMHRMVKEQVGKSKFLINHSANYRAQTKLARTAIMSGKIGHIKHVDASFASPLKWIFEDPANKGWNEPTGNMLGNGFAWGQSSHLFAWIYHVCPGLQPNKVFCIMGYSPTTGADVSHSATVECVQEEESCPKVTMSISGTSLLPGNAHSDPPVGKKLHITIYGTQGSISFIGDDRDPNSGRLELYDEEGTLNVLHDKFEFENLDNDGLGPESLQNFVELCCGSSDIYQGADIDVGARSIQTIEAMYRSNKLSEFVSVVDVSE